MALKNFLEKINKDTQSNERPDNAVSSHETGFDINKMSLLELGEAGLVVKVFSEVLSEMIYFVSSDAVMTRHQLDAVSYTAKELTAMLSMTPEEVRAAHTVKTIFHKARVIEHRRVAA